MNACSIYAKVAQQYVASDGVFMISIQQWKRLIENDTTCPTKLTSQYTGSVFI